MSSSVTIGSRPDCDLVVNVPSVSGRHCRLMREENGFVLEDLNSTNGTFVNGERIRGAARVELVATDTIHLGSHALSAERLLALIDREPAPTISFRGAEMVIGRVPGCDQVIDLPMISSRHARLFREGGRILIEDLRSSNGTFVNGTRVEGPVVLNPGDEIGLGSHRVTLAADSWTQVDVVQPAKPSEPLSGTPQAGGSVPDRSCNLRRRRAIPATGLAGLLSRPWQPVGLTCPGASGRFLDCRLGGNKLSRSDPVLARPCRDLVWSGRCRSRKLARPDPAPRGTVLGRSRRACSPVAAAGGSLCSPVPARLGDRREHGGD